MGLCRSCSMASNGRTEPQPTWERFRRPLTIAAKLKAFNERGQVVLQSENGAIDPLTGINEIRAALWTDGKIENLGTFGGNNSLANQINSRGEIVGAAMNTVSDPFSIYYFLFLGSSNGTQTRAYLWENGHKKDLGHWAPAMTP